MQTRSGAIGFLLVVLCGCGKKADHEAPTTPDPLPVVTAPESDAAVTAAPVEPPAAPAAPSTPPSTEARRSALIATLPALEGASIPADPKARYELATRLVREGDALRGLAVLRHLATDEACKSCAEVATTARGDRAWQSQWDRELFAAIVPSEGGLTHDWWAPGGPGCPKGTRLKRKPSRHDPDEGRAWCEKAGGVKHGPYWWFESGCHDGEGTCSESGFYADGKRHGWWSFAPNYYGEEHGFLERGKRVGLWHVAEKETAADTVFVDDEIQGVVRTYRTEDEELVLEEHYEDDVRHGPAREWTRYSGDPYRVVAEGRFDRGKREGAWTHWDSSDGSKAQGKYVADVLDGTWSITGADATQPGHVLVFRAGALIEIDGTPATKAQRDAWEARRQNWSLFPIEIAREVITPPAP